MGYQNDAPESRSICVLPLNLSLFYITRRPGDLNRYLPQMNMNATVRFTFDREYYESKYDDWLKHRAKWRKYSIPFACLIILSGTGLIYLFRDQWMLGSFVLIGGVFELITSLTHKLRWVSSCLKAACTEKTVKIEFEDGLMNSSSPNGTSSIKITALESIVPATNGVFLVPDNGTSIYIPQKSIDPPDSFQSLVEFLLDTLESKQDGG